MPSALRILEILVYAFVGFFPYLVLMLCPFGSRLRFSDAMSALFAVLTAVIQMLVCLLAGVGVIGSGVMMLAGSLVCVLFFLLVIHAGSGKKLFSLFAVLNQAVLIASTANFLTGMLFPSQAERACSWASALMTVVVQLVFLAPCALHWVKCYCPTLCSSRSRAPWNSLWLLPAVCAAVGLCGNVLSLPASVCTLIAMALSLLTWLICRSVFRKSGIRIIHAEPVVEEAPEEAPAPKPPREKAAPKPKKEPRRKPPKASPPPKKRPKASKEPASQLQELQYRSLQERIAESERWQQELRRHVDTMTYHLENREYDKLRTHFAALQTQFPKGIPISYCENAVLNPILAYFSQQSGFCGVKMTMDVQLPSTPADSDLAVLLGNLLDNALDACKRQKSSDRRIGVAARLEGPTLFLTVENTYEIPAVRDSKGNFLSTRHSGDGTGIPVCRQIAARRKGSLEVFDANGIFKVNVTLSI